MTRAVYDALRKPLGYTVTLEPPYAQSCVRACATLCHRQCQHILLSVFLCFPLFPCVSFCFLVFPFVFLCFPLFPFVSLLFSFVFLVFLFVSFCFLLFPFVSLCSPPKHIPLGLCVFPGPDLKPQRTFEAYRRRASALALESHQTHVYGSEKMRSGDRSASLKPTDMLLVPQSFHRRSLALCLWLRRSALRRPERTAQAHKHSGEARSGGRSAPLKLTNICFCGH